ncbi:Alpha/Beta hydrolase protein [Xylariaceae sp. FL1272]|nr:Alpha/Beta hydrolase protein [Xylariaceae sp. FL1272]
MKQVELETPQVQSVIDILPRFNVYLETYKTVNEHPIGVHILVPIEKRTMKRPVLVKLHGGGFHEGSSDSSFRPWTSTDVVDDIRDFWIWVDNELEKLPGVDADVSNLAIVGESAGGHASVIMLQYPALTIQKNLAWLSSNRSAAEREADAAFVDAYLDKVGSNKILTRAPFATRMDLALATFRSGRLVDFGAYPHLDPITSLETAERIPPVFLFHGVDDASIQEERLRRLHPDVPIHAVYPPGEHVLDKYHKLKGAWLQEPIAFVERFWPN